MTISQTCGQCMFWLKLGDCPREYGIGSEESLAGRCPSVKSTACEKFKEKKTVTISHLRLVYSR